MTRLRAAPYSFLACLSWGTRALILLLLLQGLVPAPPRAPLDVPQRVNTAQPKLCMHTRLIDEVEEWKIQRSLQLIREMGASTIVEFLPWAYIETSDNFYDWHNVDRIVRHAQNQGIRIIARMGLVPAWVRQRDTENVGLTTLNTLPRAAYPDFAEFVSAFAGRYQGVIDQIVIWNEPNLAFEWGFSAVSPVGYADLLRTVYRSAHAANPDVEILAAGLAPTLEPEGSPHGLNDVSYLEALYDAEASDFFDALAVHTYGFTHPAEAAASPDVLNFRRAELLREVMVRNGDGDKPVYVTETGWNDHPRWIHAVTPAQRVAYTLDALRFTEKNWQWAERICLWVFRYPQPTLSYPDHFTFADTVFQLHPIYYEVQAYARSGIVEAR